MDRRIPILLALIAASPLAIAATADAASKIGVTSAVNPQATGTAPGTAPRSLVIGADIVTNHKIDTSGDGLVQILFTDGSTITVGPGASLVIDKFVYNPDQGTGELVATFGKGVMRFVGGQVSKNEGGVKINTVVGTAGIRGGMANISVGQGGALFSLLYGKNLTVSGGSAGSQNIFQPGFTLQVGNGGGAGNSGTGTLIRPTTTADTLFFNQQLAGRPGQHGGAGQVPTNSAVANSSIPKQNSERPIGENAPPGVPETVESTKLPSIDDFGLLAYANSVGAVDNSQSETPTGPTNGPVKVRVLSSAGTYTAFGTTPITDPGSLGIVGANTGAGDDPLADQVIDGTLSDTSVTLDIGGTMVDFPRSTTQGSFAIPLTDTPYGAVSGSAYYGAQGDFAFFALFGNGDINNPLYIFSGVPTPATQLVGHDEVLSYGLMTDPRQVIGMPFTDSARVQNAGFASTTALYVVSPNGVKLGDTSNIAKRGASSFLLGSLLINGQGATQTSAVSLLTGSVSLDAAGNPMFATERRGSIRSGAMEGSYASSGIVASQTDGSGASIFGPNGNNFVLSNGSQYNGDVFVDSQIRDDGSTTTEALFATTHVAQLDNTIAQSTLTRTTRQLTGYAAGMLESRQLYNFTGSTGIAYMTAAPTFQINFDASSDTLFGSMTLADINDMDPDLQGYFIQFGDYNGGTNHSAFVDDDRYGARESNSGISDQVIRDNGTAQAVASTSKTYIFGSELTPQTGVFPAGVKPCQCKFLEWGYWGTRTNWKPDSTKSTTYTDNFHLGTWVAGNVTREADLPTTGVATFSGHAVGNVNRTTGAGEANYIAGGGFDMDWNFAKRAGSATISNFDGMTVSGNMAAPGVFSPSANSQFAGPLSGSGATGSLAGSFVTGPSGPAQGVIGNFQLGGDGFNAVGIVAGQRR